MIKDFVLAVKMTKYGLQKKAMSVLAAFFIIMGIFFEMFAGNTGSGIGGFYLSIIPTYFIQLMISPVITAAVSSSPKSGVLTTKAPAVAYSVMATAMYLIYAICKTIRIYAFGTVTNESMPGEIATLFVVAFLAVFLGIYNGFVYKKYILSVIVMALILFPTIFVVMRGVTVKSFININYFVGVAIGLVVTALSGVAMYFSSKAVYRCKFDPRTLKSAIANSYR